MKETIFNTIKGMTEQEYKFKITVIGDPAVGKTTLIKKYTTGAFQKEYIATLGAQFSKYEEEIDGTRVHLIIWDIAGQETYQTMRRKFYNGTSGAIIVFSQTPEEAKSFQHVENWLRELTHFCEDIPIALFGNKIDLVNESIIAQKQDKIKELLAKHGFLGYYETSAKEGMNLDDVFTNTVIKILKASNKI